MFKISMNQYTVFILIIVSTVFLYVTANMSLAYAQTAYTNKIGIKFVKIHPGSFIMGSPKSEKGRKWDEKQHKVILTKGFYLSETEITQQQFFDVMGFNPSQFKECGGNCPAETLSFHEAQEFIFKLNVLERTKRYRLPTEAEWEYACRAGSTKAFTNGDITALRCDPDPVLDKVGWYCGNSGARDPFIYNIRPHPVAMKQPNKWGLYDMHGNVAEWTSDACKPRGVWRTGVVNTTYDVPKIKNPLSKKGPNRIFRGGSWNTSAIFARCANRGSYKPTARRNSIGFRIVREL